MKKLLVSCMVCLCAGAAMAQVPVKVAETGVEALAAGASTAGKLGVQIPLISRAAITSWVSQADTPQQVREAFLEATRAMSGLTEEQKALMGVNGAAVYFKPDNAFGKFNLRYSAEVSERMNYLLLKENQQIIERAAQLRQDVALAQENAQLVRQAMTSAIRPTEGESLAHWAVGELPENLWYLCIGEEMAFMSEGLNTMDNLLTEIRAKFPGKKIVLVTSFLPPQVLSPGQEVSIPRDYHRQVWESALRNNITVVGADISEPLPQVSYVNPRTGEIETATIPSETTALGQDLQRNHLVDQAQKIWEEYGHNVLVVFYGRPVHMLYHGFSSVSDKLLDNLGHSLLSDPGSVRVIHLAPASSLGDKGTLTSLTTQFEKILPGALGMQLAEEPVLAWPQNNGVQSLMMQQLSGTDIRLKLGGR